MTQTTKVLIIGAGRRVQQYFLPAFSCLEQFELVGIHSRTKQRLDEVARVWRLQAVVTLDRFDWSKIDVVVVAVAHSGILDVLLTLQPAATDLTLIIDTPVFAHLKDFRRIDLLQRFKRVLVAEDYPALPEFKLMQRAIKSGLIGEVKHVHLLNAGWSYHGFSLIRKLLDYPQLIWLRANRFYGETAEVHFRFTGNRTATLVDPFDVDEGRILVAGDRGMIANYKLRDSGAFHVETVRDERNVPLYRVKIGEHESLCDSPTHYARLASSDHSLGDFAVRKTLGLIDLIDEFFSNTDCRYGYIQGLADHAFSKAAYGLGFFFDPFALLGTSALSVWDRTAAVLAKSRHPSRQPHVT